MEILQYRVALIVGGLLLSSVLLPAAYYRAKGCWGTDGVCKTKACLTTANRILAYMDPSVDKCQNFYKFACGKFLKTAKIEEDQRYISSVTEVNLKSNQQLKGLLEKEQKKGDPPCFTTIRQLYSLCMNEKKIQTQGLKPIKDFLKKAGGWPVLDPNWDPTEWDISQTIIRLRQLGADANSLFKLVVVEENGKHTIHVNKPELRLPPQIILLGTEHEFVKLHYDYMVEIATLLGADPKTALEDMALVYKFEIFLAYAILMTPAKWSVPGDVLAIEVSFLEESMPFFNWKTLHEAITSSYPNRDDSIQIYDVNYMHALDEMVLTQFDSRIIMNYMMWHAIFGLTHLLTDEARESEFKFNKGLYEINARQPRWRECVKVANKMTYALSAMYIKDYYDDGTKSAVNSIANRLQEELRHTIEQQDWMDEETK